MPDPRTNPIDRLASITAAAAAEPTTRADLRTAVLGALLTVVTDEQFDRALVAGIDWCERRSLEVTA